MYSDIIISFGHDSPRRFAVERRKIEAIDKTSATDWFNQQFDALGCKSRNPTGKILMRNVVVDVARAAGEPRFSADAEWADQFAHNCAALFRQQDRIHVDTETLTLSVDQAR